MAAISTEAFFDLLAKSGLLPAAKLAEVRGKFGGQDDPKAVARELVKLNHLTKWQAGKLLVGQSTLKLGKYTLLEQIGSEEVGQVYLAEHVQMGRRVVIKTLSSKHTGKPQAVKRFLDEAQRIAALHHRNIIHLFDVSSEGDRYYIVLEYVEGRDFQNLVVAEGPVSRELAADYLIQAAEGLSHAHGKKLYHGDIKPENLLLDAQGQVKILNFGVARLVEGSGEAADAQTDLAALGEVGTYLLTGKTGLADRASAPPGIESICLKLASKSAADRFASADEAIAAIKKWQTEQRNAGPADAPKIARTAGPAAKANKAPPKPKSKPPALSRPAPKKAEPLAEPEPDPVDDGIGAINIVTEPRGGKTAVADTPQFNISVATAAPKVKPKAKPAAKEKAKPQPSEAEPDVEPAAKRKLPLALIIGGSAGGGVLALLLLGLALFVFWPRGPKEVAVVEKDKVEKKEVDPEDVEKKPEPAKPAELPKPEPEKPAEPPKVEPEKAVAPPVEPPKPEPAKPDPPPVVAEKPVEPPKEPAPAPMPAAPAQNPFKDLPTIAELPALGTPEKPAEEAKNPVSLGPFTAQPKDLVFIDLVGGDKTSKGKLAFSMKAAKGGTAQRDWEISMSASGEASGGQVVALLSAKDDKLNFEWTDKALADPLANQLRNCMLSSRTGAFTHSLALRKAVEASPLTVSFEKPIKVDVPVEYPPNVDSIEIELTSLEGPFPTHKMAPKPTFEAFKGTTDVLIGKDKEETLILRAESTMKKNVSILVTPYFRLAVQRQPKEVKYSNKIFDQAAQLVSIENAKAFTMVDNMNKIKTPTPEQQAFKSTADQYFAKCQTALAQVEDLKAVCKALNSTGKIHYRIYYLAGDQQVDLVRTSPATPAAPAGAPGAAPPAVAPPAK